MTGNDDPSRKRKKFATAWKIFLVTMPILAIVFSVSKDAQSIVREFLALPGQLNTFLDEYPTLREKWLNAQQWTGMYSSFPEGVMNLEDLDLSIDSDVVLNLIYSEESHRIDGYIYSESFLGRGPLYPYLMLDGAPNTLRPNSLRLDVFDVIEGHCLIIDRLNIKREGPDGMIAVSSNGSLIDQTLRLAPDEHLTEDDLDFRSLLERARDYTRAPDDSLPDGAFFATHALMAFHSC